MFENGQKIYTLGPRGQSIEEWTYLTQDKGTYNHILRDSQGYYKNLASLKNFSTTPETCEIKVFKNKLKFFQKEKVELYAEIRRQKEQIAKHQKVIEKRKEMIKSVDRKIAGIHKGYERLLNDFPEEFI